MNIYNPKKIEKKWQKYWDKNKTFFCNVKDFSKPKFYVLDMFPYPSGNGLHVGHPKGYTASDIIARMKRMQGFNVLHPIGWDAFGLPAEQFALKNNVHPEKFTKKNIKNFKKQIKSLGFSYDWSKEISTADSNYYKWTQWCFLEFYKHKLAYINNIPVNFCPKLGTVLANEEINNGLSKRGNFPVIKKPMKQWVLKITKYADKLLEGLSECNWPKSTIEMQKNWIGKTIGTIIKFKVKKFNKEFKIFTSRPDTIYGCTFCVLAPEHPLINFFLKKEKNHQIINEIKSYIKDTLRKNNLERIELNKDKTGIFTNQYAINPINNKEIPIYIADYVTIDYGCGAIMAVPAHDKRDFDFAKKHHLSIIKVINDKTNNELILGDGEHINSEIINGLNICEAKKKINEKLINLKKGQIKICYKLKDWIFSRQRYWGEPIPILFDKNKIIPLNKNDLPLKLPKLKKFVPSGNGMSPLINATNWINVKINNKILKRETNTMPQWAGSCWYYLRYLDTKNNKSIGNKKILNHWLPVDLYIGGSEHAVLHLLYARFWFKFLHDINIVNCDEPFKKLFHQGMILGKNNEKMSKSRGNVINPDDIIKKYGADTLRLYEMFASPLEDSFSWNENGLIGARRFIERIWRIFNDKKILKKWCKNNDHKLDFIYNFTVKKVTEDFNNLQFNTAISQMMIFINEIYKSDHIYEQYIINFLKMFSCICPFICEEINKILGNKTTITYAKWPVYDINKIILNKIKIAITINGKLKTTIEIENNINDEKLKDIVIDNEIIKKNITNKKIKKIIIVKNKIVNIVI